MNKVEITGRWTKDPVVTHNGDSCVARGTIAVDRRFKREGEPTADFPSVVAFGKTAEHIENYHHKGLKAEITGRLQTGSYEKDGVTHYTTDIVIEEIGFAESKAAASTGFVQEGTTNEEGFIKTDNGEVEKIFNY